MKVKLGEDFECKYGNIDWECVTIGESNAQVYQSKEFILKIQIKTEHQNLFNEKLKMEWLKEKVPVANVIDYETDDLFEYLLMTRINGTDAAQTKWKNNPEILVTLLGNELRKLHDKININNCPFDMRLIHKFQEASYQLKTRKVTEINSTDNDLLTELISIAPKEDLVFTHGDYCLPNIIIDDQQCFINAFVDLGRAGIADRYYDLALGLRSIQFNLGQGYDQIFLNAYGLFSNIDENKIEFY
ncbi:unnamed protein product [Adineta steineri]|uniref:Aminoglycoside phosphotransferase domain-containing protein n=1 Tax=Adineta steineri TaxID=433720 RepID=A0A814G7U5_9BILA|nr:unnamed protein product [Adineta steineri]CAF0995028.1 unnamed protein product [Adineta steineri]